ncbi:MAG: hypothetical protein H6636_13120 [Anaerolineales bacterium]|nr:hypothetical protein [Anaerolineales bacterium]
MQIRCRNCNRPYALKKEEVLAALDRLHAEDLKYFQSHCPHCGKNNQIPQKDLHRAAPTWTPTEVAEAQES